MSENVTVRNGLEVAPEGQRFGVDEDLRPVAGRSARAVSWSREARSFAPGRAAVRETLWSEAGARRLC